MTQEELINVLKYIVKKCDMLINNGNYKADAYTQDTVEDIAELCNHILDGDYGKLVEVKEVKEEPVSKELEEAAYKAYPKMTRISEPHKVIPADNESHYLGDANEEKREGYIEGYKQAEKDLELTWEDIPKILSISEQLKISWWFRDNEQTKQIGTQVFWKEVLKRFKEREN